MWIELKRIRILAAATALGLGAGVAVALFFSWRSHTPVTHADPLLARIGTGIQAQRFVTPPADAVPLARIRADLQRRNPGTIDQAYVAQVFDPSLTGPDQRCECWVVWYKPDAWPVGSYGALPTYDVVFYDARTGTWEREQMGN
jgi:hypothetical protein